MPGGFDDPFVIKDIAHKQCVDDCMKNFATMCEFAATTANKAITEGVAAGVCTIAAGGKPSIACLLAGEAMASLTEAYLLAQCSKVAVSCALKCKWCSTP
jgi:hypothetical protein